MGKRGAMGGIGGGIRLRVMGRGMDIMEGMDVGRGDEEFDGGW